MDEKQQLVAKLDAAEKRYESCTGLYRQYSFDLLKLCIYVRKLTADERIRTYLEVNAADVLKRFERILFETQAPEESPVVEPATENTVESWSCCATSSATSARGRERSCQVG